MYTYPLTRFLAHTSGLKAGDPWWLAWHFDTLIVGNLAALAAVYAWGTIQLWKSVGIGRVASKARVAGFFCGTLATGIALLSPLDTLSSDLSWVHMVQHMVLMVVAAPLMMFGSPGIVFPWAIPKRTRKTIVVNCMHHIDRGFRRPILWGWNPITVWLVHAIGLWVWHLPLLYERALEDPLVHDIEHLTFFLIACLFWRVLLDSRQSRRISTGLGVLYLFTTSIHTMFLGVFMALSPSVWYPAYEGRTQRWGLKLLEDQQLAGAIMWMPACTVYAVVTVLLLVSWLERCEPSDHGSFVSDG